ncbi:hypothetical protein [Escherichia phage FL15]
MAKGPMNEMSVHVDIGSDRFGRYTDLVYADLVMTFQRDASGNFWFWYAVPRINQKFSIRRNA